MTPKHLEMRPFEINGWTIRPCDEDGNDGWCLVNGHERYHHTHLEVAVATAQDSKRDINDVRDDVARGLTEMVTEAKLDPVRLARIWAHELERLTGTPDADARRALLLQLLEYIDAKHETIARLNTRAQEAEHRLAVFHKAVGEWVMEEGKTYIPLHTLTAIAKAAGKEFDAARYISHGEQMVRLKKRVAEAEAKLNDETAPLTVDTGQLEQLKAQLARFTDTMPSWAHGQPMDYDAWLRDLVPDDNRLKFYQWIGELALREVLDELLRTLGDDPVPVKHRSYSPQDVEEMISLYHPSSGETAPSQLPMGHRFCDVDWHTHTHGGDRLPSCRLDSPE